MSEYVLVKKNHRAPRDVFHKPSEDNPDRPDCHVAKARDIAFLRKDPDVLSSDARMCKDCSGESERHSHQGPELGAKLAKMDSEAI